MTGSTPAIRNAPGAVSIPKAGFLDTLAVFAEVLLPTFAKGIIMRRRAVLALAQSLDLDRRAVRRMQRVRDRYGSAPLMLRIPGRRMALILDPDDVHRVLAETPEPFATSTAEKRAALAHFEPKGVLLSRGAERADRRRFNEQVLDAEHPVHKLADSFLRVVSAETGHLRQRMRTRSELTWDDFASAWFRIVRRVVFGDRASEDHKLSAMMAELRSAANWAFLRPPRKELREAFLERIESYLDNPEPGSLASVAAHVPKTAATAPEQQVPQWLFAFDPAGMATFRALALLASHPEHAAIVRQELNAGHELPALRSTVLESLRLWPTSPLVLRETTGETEWREGMMPPHTAVIVFAPFFHRDSETLSYADRFAPEVWADGQTHQQLALIPFSEGPAICPGRHLVLLLSTAMIAEVLRTWRVRLKPAGRLGPALPLPGTLNHYGLRFELRA